MVGILLFMLQIAVVPAGENFTCTPTHVWDGDGPIWCEEGPRLRLTGIAARELDGSWSQGHLCPASDPIASRDALVNLLGKKNGAEPHDHILIAALIMACSSTVSAGRFAPLHDAGNNRLCEP